MAINTKLAALIAAPAVALALPAVQAQEGTEAPTGFQQGFSGRLGANWLTDSDTKDFIDGTDFFGGLSYGLKNNGRIDFDFSRNSDGGNDIKSFGLIYTHLFPFDKKGKFYGGLGLGIYRVDADIRGVGGGGQEEPPISGIFTLGLGDYNGVNESSTKIGGKALLGYNFSDKFFGEVAYTKIGDVDGADASNVSVALGLRF